MLTRRPLLRASLAAPFAYAAGAFVPAWAQSAPNPGSSALPAAAEHEVAKLLREGGAVIAFRHALAPGTFDPPGFQPGVCSTQRNLSDEGRAQARRLGEWFRQRGLKPARVRSSPWCRCLDTATLAFGSAETWVALGSPHGTAETTNAESLQALRQAVLAATAARPRFEVWVTHQFVLNRLAQTSTSSGEGLVLRADAAGAPQVLARMLIAE